MSVKKIENFNIHEQPESNTDSFGVEAYLNANWEKTKEAVNNNAEELIQSQKDIDANKNDIENINSKNKSQDDTIEALKAENKLIKEQIPSANISENSVHIEDSSNLDFDWKIKGGHAQTRTTQPENYIDDREARGKTILEATSLYLPIINLKAGSGYYFKIFDSNDKIKNDSRYLAVEFYDINKTKIQSDALGYPNTFTEENANKIKFAKIYYNKNDTDKAIGSIVIKKIGLKITSSASSDDIDMFVPDSPSPDYPSKIETVGSNVNEFDCKESYTNKGLTLTKYKDGSFKIEGTATVTTTFAISNYLKLQGVYTFKAEWLEGTSPYFWFYSNINKKNIVELTSTNGVKVVTLNNEDEIILGINIEKGKAYSFTSRVKIEKGTVATPYSSPGMGCVKINVINKNFINMQKKTTSWSGAKVTVENNKITFVGATDGSLGLNFSSYESKIKMSKGNKITYSSKYVSGSYTSGKTYYNLKLIYQDGTSTVIYMDRNVSTYKNNISKTIILEKDVVAYQINGSGYTISGLTNELVYEFQLEIGDSASEIVEQSSQTAIMPIQQEMLTGDYIKDVEHHEWEKLVLTGNENWGWNTTKEITQVFQLDSNINMKNENGYCNCLKTDVAGDAEKISFSSKIFIAINKDRLSTVSVNGFKEYLKQKYESGTPIIIYYKLAELIDLELTSEQKTVRDTKLYTYKNITNISLSDELASVEVEYKKDQDTINKNYENRLAALEAASIS